MNKKILFSFLTLGLLKDKIRTLNIFGRTRSLVPFVRSKDGGPHFVNEYKNSLNQTELTYKN